MHTLSYIIYKVIKKLDHKILEINGKASLLPPTTPPSSTPPLPIQPDLQALGFFPALQKAGAHEYGITWEPLPHIS